MNLESLLKIWLESEPTAKSDYAIYGYPMMWETLRIGERVLFSRPAKVMERPAPFLPYEETDGVRYQWQESGRWVDQMRSASFSDFLRMVNGESAQ